MNVKRKNLSAVLSALLTAVHGDQDGHGDEREFPEAEVEHQVERDEDAEHGRLLDEEKGIEGFAAGLNRVPTGDDADRREQSDQNHEPEAERVDADVVENCWILNPETVDLKLETGPAGDEMRGQMESEDEGGERGDERDPVGKFGAVGQKSDEDSAGKGREQNQSEHELVDLVHRSAPAPFKMMCSDAAQSPCHEMSRNSRRTAAAAASQAA